MNTYITLALAVLLCGVVQLSAQFSAPISIPFADTINRYEVLDFEGDGDLDLFIETDTAYYWLPNEGDGTFAPPVALDQLQGDIEVIPIDYESDGDIDLVYFPTTHRNRPCYVHLQTANGSFSDAILFYEGHGSTITRDDYHFGHFNTDGYIDFAFDAVYSGAWVHYNPADTTVLSWTWESFGHWDFGLIDIVDLDNNGQLDILGCHTQYRRPRVYYLGENPDIGPIGYACLGDDVYFFDISGDNRLDWINPHGVVFARGDAALSLNDFSPSDLLEDGDVNGDGQADLLARQGGELVVYYNYGDAQFSSPISISTEVEFADLRHPHFADLDKDGALDIVALQQSSLEFIWFRNESQSNRVTVFCYWDENSNGIHEPEEPAIPNLPMQQTMLNQTHFTNDAGEIVMKQPSSPDNLEVGSTNSWEPVAGPQNYALNDWLGDTLSIGYHPVTMPGTGQPTIHVSHGAGHCGETVSLQLRLNAPNLSLPTGILALVLNEDTPLLSTQVAPVLIEDQTYWWTIEEFPNGQAWTNQLILEFPDSSAIGDTLAYNLYFFSENCEDQINSDAPGSDLTEGLNLCIEKPYEFIVDCAIETNDKQVSPRYLSPANYITANDLLTYTIRFTNNTSAQQNQCIIRDRLDRNLDWNSLRIIDASHPYRTTLNKTNGELRIHFDNLDLTPVDTDPLNSQGYVTYQIRPLDSSLSSVVIKNSAEIIFANRPTISTNTVQNTLVDTLPEAQAPKAIFDFALERDSLELYTFDQSLHQPLNWHWTFGDGNSSNEVNASHRYEMPGTYEVCLYTSNAHGLDSLCKTIEFPANYVDNIPIEAAHLIRNSIIYTLCLPGDFNGNGTPDIVTTNSSDNNIEILFNRGDGSFLPPVFIYDGPERIADFAAAHINDDDHLDLIVAFRNGQIIGYFNDGNGSFDPPQILAEREDGGTLRVISIADVDQDGDSDIIATGTGYLTWVENNGIGQFTVTHVISEQFRVIVDIATGDLDGDGDIDLAISTSMSGTGMVVSLMQENKHFRPAQQISPLSDWPGNWSGKLYLTDLTNDGLPELVHEFVYNNSNDPFYICKKVLENENGYFQNEIFVAIDFSSGVGSGDMDNDGDVDIAHIGARLSGDLEALYIGINQGNGAPFVRQEVEISTPLLYNVYRLPELYVLDMDQDGDLDILTNSDRDIVWYENKLTPQQPRANFTYETNGLTVNFTDRSSRNPDEWLWTFGAAGPGSTLQNPIYEFPEEGTYTVCLHVRNEDGRSVSCEDVTLLINNTAELNRKSFQLYPNPTVGEVTLTLQEAFSTPTYLQLYDPLGQVLGHAIPIKGTQLILDLRPYPAGNYSFRLFNDEGLITQGKLVRTP